MIHFSGDQDGAVPTTGTYNWIQTMGRDIKEDFRPYYIDGQFSPAGYIVEYDGLTYATVHGAGHMAPQFKPAETYHLIFNWIKQNKI